MFPVRDLTANHQILFHPNTVFCAAPSLDAQAAPDETDAGRRPKGDAKLLALSMSMAEIGFSRTLIPNGTYDLIDKDGFHYAPFGGL